MIRATSEAAGVRHLLERVSCTTLPKTKDDLTARYTAGAQIISKTRSILKQDGQAAASANLKPWV